MALHVACKSFFSLFPFGFDLGRIKSYYFIWSHRYI